MNNTVDCDMALLVQADFDGELDAIRSADVETHRAGCARCQATYADLQRLRTGLRTPEAYYAAPETLRAKIATQIAQQTDGAAKPSPPKAEQRVAWTQRVASFGFGAAVAAGLTLFVMAPGQNNLVDDVVANHVRSLQPGHLQDVASTDQHTVKPWFDGKLDFAPPVKDLKDQGFPLEGGRLDVLDGRPVAALVYGRAKHQINVFAWPASGGGDTDLTASARNGYNVVHFVRGGMNLWIVSDVEKSDLALFARFLQTAP